MKVFTPPSTPSSSKKNVQSIQPERKSRRKFDFSIKTLQLYSHYRQDDAAKELGVAPITLKRICQRRKYRWPYRTIKAKLRREALAAEKLRNTERLTTRMTTPSSPSLAAPELLLSLSKERKTFSCSPTSVSDVDSTKPIICSPKPRFLLKSDATGLNQLPPLTWVLQRHRMQPPATLPQPLHQLNYKSSFYSASFHAAAPTFPMRTTLSSKEHGKTLQPLLEHEQPHYANI
ncbi:RWP-RK domain [Phytophthora infestans]|uniref:RWP-RK domain n=1 Tax=Phytophthora infestans TaxID=4787 RepID=A0A833WXU8_PHYIN|nr:RWP-RK domain [Phytophthora infestans]